MNNVFFNIFSNIHGVALVVAVSCENTEKFAKKIEIKKQLLSSVTCDTIKLEIEYLHQAGVKAARRIARLAAFLSAFLHP